MLLGAGGGPLTNINAYNGHLAFQRFGVRSIDDVEFNELVNTDSQVAKQMRQYAVWTSFLTDVQSNAKEGGYTAKHIARPDVSVRDGRYAVGGDKKPTKLPNKGWFTVKHILASDDGLPHETTPNMPDEPCAYLATSEGKERPVLRGDWAIYARREFGALASWGSLDSYPSVGVRGASDEKPKPIVFARAEALRSVESLSNIYGVTPAEIVASLGQAIEEI